MKHIKQKIKKHAREKDVFAKTICLILAMILWAFISTGKTERLKYKIPITVKNVPPQLTVSMMSTKFATLLIEGRKDDIKSVNLKGINAIVDLEKATAGDHKKYIIHVEKQQIPEEISISIIGKEVEMSVEKKEDKWVQVIPNITGSVQPGKIIIDKIAIPDRVRISGPKTVLMDIESVETNEISVDNETGSVQRLTGIKMDKTLKDLSFNENFFTVKVVITDLKDLIVVTVPISMRNALKDFQYEIKGHDVEVYVKSKNYRRVRPEDIEAFVDAGKLNVKKIFEDEKKTAMVREMPVVIFGKKINTTDIISFMPKKMSIKITRKQNQ